MYKRHSVATAPIGINVGLTIVIQTSHQRSASNYRTKSPLTKCPCTVYKVHIIEPMACSGSPHNALHSHSCKMYHNDHYYSNYIAA